MDLLLSEFRELKSEKPEELREAAGVLNLFFKVEELFNKAFPN